MARSVPLRAVSRPSARGLDALGTAVRLGLAAVWLVSGGLKAADPGGTRLAVGANEMLPGGLVDPVATGLPLVELALGTVILVGALTRLAARVSQAWARASRSTAAPVPAVDAWISGGAGRPAAEDGG